MKKSILSLLALLVCAIQSTTAYEYFTIYFSDGNKSEAFYATDVDSICYSKLSLDNVAYDDWQVQEIYTCDSVYRYPLVQIDSLSFKDVDEDEMVERTAYVCCNITPYYAQCESINEISVHLAEIKNIDGVEDARVDGLTLFVKVEDSGTLTYDYTSEDEPYEDLFVESMQSNTRSNFRESVSFDHQDFSDISNVCVINQQYRDEERKHKQNAANQFIQFCNELGLYCNPVNDPTPQFFSKEIYNYDLIFMITHGYYDKETGLHWFLTGEQLYVSNKEGDVDEETLKNVIKEMWRRNSMTNLGMLSSNFIYIGTHKEVRNGKKVPVYYTQISNKYISVGNEDFRKPGKAIIFNTACQSLMGKKGKDNNNLAKAFFKRGAGLYMGYNEENYKGHSAGVYFLAGLMNGKSSYGSYMSIPIEFRDYEYLIR